MVIFARVRPMFMSVGMVDGGSVPAPPNKCSLRPDRPGVPKEISRITGLQLSVTKIRRTGENPIEMVQIK